MTPNPSPRISVVMGVYNAGERLSRALDSILGQLGVELEFIIVNDGSTDGSGAILDAAARRDARVRVLHQENQGLTCALLRGCAEARGEYIARQDADDVSRPGRLAAQWERATARDRPVLVAPGCDWRTPEGEGLLEVRPPPDPVEARRQILEQGRALCCHGALLFRRDAYLSAGRYRPAFLYAQDIDLILRLAALGPVATLPGCHYDYLYSPLTITGRHAPLQVRFFKMAMQAHELRAAGRDDAVVLQQADALKQECRHAAPSGARASPVPGYTFIASLLRDRNPRLARAYLRRALRLHPLSPRLLLRYAESFLHGPLFPKRGARP